MVIFLLILGLQQTIIIGWLVLHYVHVPVSLLNTSKQNSMMGQLYSINDKIKTFSNRDVDAKAQVGRN